VVQILRKRKSDPARRGIPDAVRDTNRVISPGVIGRVRAFQIPVL